MDITPRQFEIIEASGRILTTSGVSGLTIKHIAQEMRFSESAIYRHFASKEEIIIALLDYLSNTLDERLQHTVESDSNAESKFISIFRDLIDFFTKHPEFVVAVFSDGLFDESQHINQTILKLMNVLTKHLFPVIRDGQHNAVFTNAITTEELGYIAIGTFKLQMFKWKMASFQFDIEKEGDKIIRALLILLKNH